ncbi:MAG: cytidine deaminase [Eubacteriales bacterium]|nr:cytidine deaminase [Eubacteriales bacterium]
MDKELIEKLIEISLEQRSFAYVPYSGFKVGAALLCDDGTVYTGCNIENAAFTPTNCAERTAIFKAVSEGQRSFKAICVSAGRNEEPDDFAAPCGVCRQVMMEFCNPDFKIIMAVSKEKYKIVELRELLPLGFRLEA